MLFGKQVRQSVRKTKGMNDPDITVPVSVNWGARTAEGGRAENQDAVRIVTPGHPGIAERGWLMVVCDGVGGEVGGHIAAVAAADAAIQAYYDDVRGDTPRAWLDAAVKRAHLAVLREATKDNKLRRMSTTLVAASVFDNKAYVAHAGDSRAYLARGYGAAMTFTRLTHDHRDDATNSVTRSLGSGANHDAEFLAEPIALQPGDRLMLCTDGVYGVLDDAALRDILAKHYRADDAASALLAAAMERQTDDNITAAVLNYGEQPGVPGGARKRKLRGLGVTMIGLLILAGALFTFRATYGAKTAPTPRASPRTTPLGAPSAAGQTVKPNAVESAEPDWQWSEEHAHPTIAPILEQTQQAQQTIQPGQTHQARDAALQTTFTATQAAQPTGTPAVTATTTVTATRTPEPELQMQPPPRQPPSQQLTQPPPSQPLRRSPAPTSDHGGPGMPRNGSGSGQ